MSRSAEPNLDANQRIEKLKSFGIDVLVEACDVSSQDDVDAVFARLRSRYKISGIIHSAMVLDDKPVNQLSKEDLTKTLNAKVSGAANLDRATRQDTLDYFVVFSNINSSFRL